MKNRSIKHKIFLGYLCLSVFPLCLIALFTYYKSSSIIEDKALKQFHSVSQMASQQFDNYFLDIENLSINILQNREIQQSLNQPPVPSVDWTMKEILDEQRLRDILSGVHKLKPGISSIIIYGFNQRSYFYHPTRRWNIDYDGRSEEWFQEAVEAKGLWVLSDKREEQQIFDPLVSEYGSVITFGRVINDLDTRKPLGVMAINVDFSFLEKLASVNNGASELLVLDRKGNQVIASPNAGAKLQDSNWLQARTGSAFTRWETIYISPIPDLFKESKQVRNFSVMVAVILCAASLVMANVISSGIVNPLIALKRKMKKVEQGEFEGMLVPQNRDEVGELTQSFNRMLDRLKSLVEEIRLQEQQKTEIELSALQARINPHFMYNTLNGIRWVAMMDGNQRVTEHITSLVYLLQFSAKNKDSLISVKNELELLRHYADLMKMRNDQFDFKLQVQEGLEDRDIIPFLLQPLVENAIFHGIIPLHKHGLVEVGLHMEHGVMTAVVRDNGVGMDPSRQAGLFQSDSSREGSFNKIGVKNVYDRLRLTFGDQAGMSVDSVPDAGTEVRVWWPDRKRKEDNHD